VLKTRKARANRLRAVRRRGGDREGHETAAESEYVMVRRPRHALAQQQAATAPPSRRSN